MKTLTNGSKRPRKIWWLIGVIVFIICVLVQMPAAWIVQKYFANTPYLQYVSGNLWQGTAIWQLPESGNKMKGRNDLPVGSLTGDAKWTWQPLALLKASLGANVDINTSGSRLSGAVGVGKDSWQLKNLSGKIMPQTLSHFVSWQLPQTPIQVNALSLARKKEQGFIMADGQLTWVGGKLGYPSGNKMFQINLPAMRGQLMTEQKDKQDVLHMRLVDNKDNKLGDFYLNNELMLDVNLTQRLLQNMPTYKGKAPLDTPVVSVRQPLLSQTGS